MWDEWFAFSRWRTPLIIGCVVFVVGLVGWLIWVGVQPPAAQEVAMATWDRYARVLGVAWASVTMATALVQARRPSERENSADDGVMRSIAGGLHARWAARAEQQGLLTDPIDVRWRVIDGSAVSDVGMGAVPRYLDLVPGVATVDRSKLDVGGGRAELHQIHLGLSTGRLIVVGETGAGKTSTAILLLLDALEHRMRVGEQGMPRGSAHPGPDGARAPTPVLYSLHSWDPRPTAEPRHSIVHFVALKIAEDFPELVSVATAADLLRAGRFTVVLDDFDRIDSDLRSLALTALNDAPFRLVLLSGRDEAVRAAKTGVLVGAVTVELRPVSPTQAADYLSKVMPHDPAWRSVAEHLRQHDTREPGPVVAALAIPRLLALVRKNYLARRAAPVAGIEQLDIDELLDPRRFPTVDAIERHLQSAEFPGPGIRRPRLPRWMGWRNSASRKVVLTLVGVACLAVVAVVGTKLAGVDFGSQRGCAPALGAENVLIGISQDTSAWSVFERDLAQSVADDLCFEPLFVSIPRGVGEEYLDDGLVDLVIASLPMNDERSARVVVAGPYATTVDGVLVRQGQVAEGVEGLDGLVICSSAGSTSIDDPSGYLPEAIEFSSIELETTASCEEAVRKGVADGMVSDRLTLYSIADEWGESASVTDISFGSQVRYGIGMSSRNEQWCEPLSGAIRQFVESGKWSNEFAASFPQLSTYQSVEFMPGSQIEGCPEGPVTD